MRYLNVLAVRCLNNMQLTKQDLEELKQNVNVESIEKIGTVEYKINTIDNAYAVVYVV
ncbi:MAG: hypothetical protein ACRC18_06970 [Cetobacterium sp.]